MNALIELSGKQFEVQNGSSIKVPKINEKVGSKIIIDQILYFEDGKNKVVGTPFVKGKKINCEIVSHGRDRKVMGYL